MADIEIKVKIDGVEYTQEQLGDMAKSAKKATKATKDLGKESKKAAEEGSALGLLKGKISGVIGPIKGVVAGMKTLKGAIISTGVGALVVALGALVSYFTTSEEGSKKLAIAMETLGILWGKLTEAASELGEKLVGVFTNPKEAIIEFRDTITNFVSRKIDELLESVGLLGEAIALLFKGEFKEAAKTAGEAVSKLNQDFNPIIATTELVIGAGKKLADVYKNEIVPAVKQATETATELVNRERALVDQKQKLIVENAELNKELETQQRIAEDTTRTYEERKAALEKAGEAQVKLAANVAAQAKNEEGLLKLRIETANSFKEREELETQLAEATAARIDAETALETKKLEQSKITIELDMEELERKRSIQTMIDELDTQGILNAKERALAELDISEKAALAELDLLKATEEEKNKVKKAYTDARAQIEEDALLQQASDNAAVFAQIASGYEEGTALYKAFKIAEVSMNTFVTAQTAYNSAAEVPMIGPVLAPIAAASAIAAGLKQVRAIQNIEVPKAESGGLIMGASHSAGGSLIEAEGGEYIINKYAMRQPGVAEIASGLNQSAGPNGNSGGMAIKTYVVAQDVSNAQEANNKIKNLSRL